MYLGKYEVLGQIGSGGFGRVLLARSPDAGDPATGLVAIKRLRKAKAQHKRVRAAIEYEAKIGRYLSHPNIVRVIEFAEVGNDLILVMEFINGIGLDELLSQHRRAGARLEAPVALKIALQAGKGLAAAHSACAEDGTPLRIVHRDVKPSNIMICRQGRVRIMDFGVALGAFRKIHTTTGTIKGTLRYLSPEQAAGSRDIGPATDQFALGLVLGEMLTGEPVYNAKHEHRILLRAMRGEVGAAVRRADDVLPGVGSILGRALSFKVQERYPTMADFVEQLERLFVAADLEEPDLSAIVHAGLEERARLALEEEELWGGESSTAVQDRDESRLAETPVTPLGHNGLGSGPREGRQEVVEVAGSESGGWCLLGGDLPPGEELAHATERWTVIAESESKVIEYLDDSLENDSDWASFESDEWPETEQTPAETSPGWSTSTRKGAGVPQRTRLEEGVASRGSGEAPDGAEASKPRDND